MKLGWGEGRDQPYPVYMCRYHEFGTTVGENQHVRITTVHSLFKSHSNRLYMHVDITPNKCFEFQELFGTVKISFGKLTSLYFYIHLISPSW